MSNGKPIKVVVLLTPEQLRKLRQKQVSSSLDERIKSLGQVVREVLDLGFDADKPAPPTPPRAAA